MSEEVNQRRGPWSADERKYIEENCDDTTYLEIDKELRRNPDAVKKFIEKTLGRKIKSASKSLTPDSNIRSSPIWKELEQEFSPEELQVFIWQWNRIINQFKDDVLPTEELQIIDTIKLEILQGRALKHQKESISMIKTLEQEMKTEQNLGDDADNGRIDSLNRQISFYYAGMESLSKEYSDLLTKKGKMLEGLKATRAERIKRIESSRLSLIGWISEVLRNTKLRRELGLRMEKMRIAISVEEARLMEPHKYIDNTIDCPMLNSKTIERLKEAKDE